MRRRAVAYAARAGLWDSVPAAARQRLTDGLAASRARHLVMTRELTRVLRHWAAEGIDVIPLKGPVLAEAVYPDAALRPFRDLDLLVRPEDRRRADVALRGLGYEPLAVPTGRPVRSRAGGPVHLGRGAPGARGPDRSIRLKFTIRRAR